MGGSRGCGSGSGRGEEGIVDFDEVTGGTVLATAVVGGGTLLVTIHDGAVRR